jgi:hypothetical protein
VSLKLENWKFSLCRSFSGFKNQCKKSSDMHWQGHWLSPIIAVLTKFVVYFFHIYVSRFTIQYIIIPHRLQNPWNLCVNYKGWTWNEAGIRMLKVSGYKWIPGFIWRDLERYDKTQKVSSNTASRLSASRIILCLYVSRSNVLVLLQPASTL